jgi:tripartite-type tricarboxylate transporter receptor subunit TctC
VAKSAGDGYTLVLGTVGTHSINGSLYEKMPYDMVKNFSPVSLIASAPNLLVVNNNVPVKTVPEFVAYLKANPDKLSFGSPGVGTSVHVSGELFKSMTGTKMTHVPYKGRQYAIPDLVGGSIQLMFDNMPSALPMAREGKIRAIAVTTAKRSAAAPEIPTIAESIPGFEATTWFAMFAPAGTPKAVVDRLNAEVLRVFRLPEVGERLKTLGLEPVLSSPEELAAYQSSEIAKWTKVVKESGARAE